MENKVHLFFQSYVAVNRAVKVIGFINPNPGPLEAGINDVLQDNLQRLSVLLVHGEQEKRKHKNDHQKGSKGCSHCSFSQEKHRQTANGTDAETNDLTLGQAKEKLGFDFRQILGNRNVCDNESLLFCMKKTPDKKSDVVRFKLMICPWSRWEILRRISRRLLLHFEYFLCRNHRQCHTVLPGSYESHSGRL